MAGEQIRIMVSRHSAFYSPLLAAIRGGFLKDQGLEPAYAILQPGQKSHELIRKGEVEVMQSAVSSNWSAMDNGVTDLPRHFAQINRRDGFFLVARVSPSTFHWKMLEGGKLLADHGLQPLVMLRYAAELNQVEWKKVALIDAGPPEQMAVRFRRGEGEYIHLQGPAAQELESEGTGKVVASIGDAMPPVAFSSLAASAQFLETDKARGFLAGYRRGRNFVTQSPAADIARLEKDFFPAVGLEVLTRAIARYQQLGCWQGSMEIPRNLYEQALTVFLHCGAIKKRHEYEAVVAGIQ